MKKKLTKNFNNSDKSADFDEDLNADFNMEENHFSQGILKRQKTILILKELFRKSIHICSAIIPLLLKHFYLLTIILLSLAIVFYTISEILRMHGKNVPLISQITVIASRKRDENKFVLGPVTLAVGILITSLLYKWLPASIGIFSLSFGDGLASLFGKLFGQVKVPFTQGKSVAGSLTCFTAIFVSSFFLLYFNGSSLNFLSDFTELSLILATIGMFIEVLPLKDFDNLLIPILIGGISQIFLC